MNNEIKIDIKYTVNSLFIEAKKNKKIMTLF